MSGFNNRAGCYRVWSIQCCVHLSDLHQNTVKDESQDTHARFVSVQVSAVNDNVQKCSFHYMKNSLKSSGRRLSRRAAKNMNSLTK